MSVVDAADDTLEIGGDDCNGKYIYPSCDTELAKLVPFFLPPGTLDCWHWQRKYPVSGKRKDNDEPHFSLQELEVLVVEDDAVTLLVERARGRTDPGDRVVMLEKL